MTLSMFPISSQEIIGEESVRIGFFDECMDLIRYCVLFTEGEKQMITHLLPQEIEELLGNLTRSIHSFFLQQMRSEIVEETTRYFFCPSQRSENKEIINLFKIISSGGDIFSNDKLDVDHSEERFLEMTNLFTLSINELDLVHHKGFAFSIDSYKLD
ncbi:hypothetical protein Cgig2_020763 [Carnegiea gigantea]|uniref:Ycf2 N-terminal domain-containing protein n=1 Tax=Carnegiea gigantea TaxID=171969 RepID=A0A9Q1QBT0_9CARY|nr:hypothetical protein Cgig2_020763 [Carnegiea gigantea]